MSIISVQSKALKGILETDNLNTKQQAELQDPSKLLQTALVLKDSRTTKAGIATFSDEKKVFIKRYNNKGFVYTLKYLFRKARGFRAWNSAKALELIDIPTPKNIAALEERNGLKLIRGWLFTEVLDDLVDLIDFYNLMREDESLRANYAKSISSMLAVMHTNGISHGDLKISNTYMQCDSSNNYTFGFWDLDGTSSQKNALSFNQRIKELGRLIASFVEFGMRFDISYEQSYAEELFLTHYKNSCGVDLKSEKLSAIIAAYITKSHQRILKNKQQG